MNKIKIILIFVLLIILAGCLFKDKKIVILKIDNNDIIIKWYYYSYITDFSNEFVEVSKEDKHVIIYESRDVVTNITLDANRITIKTCEPYRKQKTIYTKVPEKEVFGYKILFDTTASYEEYRNIPNGKPE